MDNETPSIGNYGDKVSRLVDEYERQVLALIDKEYERKTTRADKVADKVAEFGGSWTFITVFSLFLGSWMLINTLQLTKIIHFDEPPFILLNLILSFTAAFQAPIIMMSQNRQAKRDRREAIIDYSINYKAELEIDDMQGHLHRIEDDFAAFRKEVAGEMSEIKQLLLQRSQRRL
ncbi:DUF1003 domain-containing protein [Paenibacillus beijingensis]|uniref:DUF1003 domain-containing protein n=1 Tax=Paenibacillus beijingensis TaxID=1126833 RepID=UPI000AAA2E46|nr:DUF1003 domain-containing protein [Paenibacillus beijingensis]